MSALTIFEQARAWVKDCAWADLTEDEDFTDLTPGQIRRGVERHYVGGWDQFVKDADPPAPGCCPSAARYGYHDHRCSRNYSRSAGS